MVEQIEADRKALREKSYKNGTAKASYIPLLSSPPKKTKTHLKLHNLSTINILNYIDESFRLGDRYVLTRLEMMRHELLSRKDLFEAVLRFLQGAAVRSDLHYWLPGLSTDNIFSFTVQLVPNFVERYRSYFTRCTILGETPLNCLSFIQERFKDAHDRFRVIQEDLSLFDSCLSHPFWTDRPLASPSARLVHLLGTPDTYVDVAADLEGVLVSELSFAECTIAGRPYVVSLLHLDGLLSKDADFKAFWMELGAVDENWELLE